MISDKDLYYMQLALVVAQASKCKRAKYGTVIVSHDGRVVSTGFNGKPRGSINDNVCYRENLPANDPGPKCCLHSEANAVMFCSPEELHDSTVYVSGVCCTDCALMLAQMQVKRVIMLTGHGNHVGNFDWSFYSKYGMKFEVEYIEWAYFEEKGHLIGIL